MNRKSKQLVLLLALSSSLVNSSSLVQVCLLLLFFYSTNHQPSSINQSSHHIMLRFTPSKLSSANNNSRKIFSFSGSGWMMIFHLGAVRAIQERPELLKNSIFCGASGGALAAAVAALDVNTEKLKAHIIKESNKARRTKIDYFRLRPLIENGIDIVLTEVGFGQQSTSSSSTSSVSVDDENKAWKEQIQPRIKDRCEVAITVLRPKLEIVAEKTHETKRTFVEALVASCCIPPFAGFPFYNEKKQLVVDGGILRMIPRFREKGVITVSFTHLLPYKISVTPASGRGSGRQALPIRWALFPPNEQKMEATYWAGYREMKKYLENDPNIVKNYPVVANTKVDCSESSETITTRCKILSDAELLEKIEMTERNIQPVTRYYSKLVWINVLLTVGMVGGYFRNEFY